MKKFYTVIFSIFLVQVVLAQEPRGKEIDTLWQHQINQVFQHLDLERVPHGVLLDYAMEFTDVSAYGPGELYDSNRVDIDVFTNIYKTLYMGMTAPDPVSSP